MQTHWQTTDNEKELAFPAGAQRRTAPSIVPFGVSVPDVYLLIAECKARMNDRQGAAAKLKQFRENRMPETNSAVPSAVVGDQMRLLQFIMEERLREFAGLGVRWFDMRRLSVDPMFTTTTAYTHTLYSADGTATIYQLKPERFVFKIPPRILLTNPGMQDNP